MAEIHKRTMHVAPANVHAHDPEGFEQLLRDAAARVRALFDDEDATIEAVVAGLPPDECGRLATDLTAAQKHASERPNPPRTAVGRLISNVNVKLDRAIEDVASPQHPAHETIDG